MPMSSSKRAIRHTGGPIESLCTIFSIPRTAKPAANHGATRSFCQLRIHCSASQWRAANLRPSLSSQPTSSRLLAFQPFSTTQPAFVMKDSSSFKTMEQLRSRGRLGPLTFKAAALFLVTGVAVVFYFREERARLERQQIAEQAKGIGKPKVGGPFNLIDHHGRPFTSEDLKGKYSLVYFGFTHCPDICPDELDKMADMIDHVKADCGDVLIPVMISCDPARDMPAVLKPYIEEFHKDLIGLTGEYEEIKKTCKEYRVYFSTPPQVKPGQDYLVDHSIYFYLMDPEGDFVEAIGRNFTAEQAARVIRDHIKDWNGPLDRSPRRKEQ